MGVPGRPAPASPRYAPDGSAALPAFPGLEESHDRRPRGRRSGGELRDALEKAGRLLTLRPRTVREMADRLALAGFAPDVVDAALARLAELRLTDDLAFAAQWIEERASRGRGPAALMAELAAKGVDSETARRALEEAGLDEEREAARWAERLVPKVTHRPIAYQAAYLQAALARRGFSEEAAEAAVRAVLPPEGWD